MGNEIEGISPEEMAMVEADRTGADVPEAAPEVQEATPEATEVPAVEAKPEPVKPPEGFVPHGALHEERAKRKEMQQKFQELNEKFARADERLKLLTEGKKPNDPSFDDDPLGYSKHELDKLNKVTQQYPEQYNELRGEIENLRLQRNVEKMENSFERTQPDYRQALEFYAKSRADTITELGYDNEEAVDMVRSEMVKAISKAMETGRNPAEVVYKMATRSGYASKGNDTAKLDTLKKAEVASRSLSDSSGKAKGELSAEALADMTEEEFSKISEEDFRKAMGG